MERFFTCVDRMVAEGVAVYIELLCSGEERRSKQLLRDLMQVSSLAAGGPSSKLGSMRSAADTDRVAAGSPERSIAWALIYFTLRSILSSLLVLRASRYWNRIPRLENLQTCCRSVADIVEEIREGERGVPCTQCDEGGLAGCCCQGGREDGPIVPAVPKTPEPEANVAAITARRASLAVAETH
jgi:hypothetical protein